MCVCGYPRIKQRSIKMNQNAAAGREYIDVNPDTRVVSEEDTDTLLVFLPGFNKEQLRLQLTPARTLKITGERPLGGTKWIRLQREYPVSKDCDTRKITARFENGTLNVVQPKSVKPGSEETHKAVTDEAQKLDQKPANDLPQPQKPASEIQKADGKPTDDQPQPKQTNDQETKSMVDQSKHKEEKKGESVDDGSVDKGGLEREKGEERERKRDGVDEDGKGKMRETSEGRDSCGFPRAKAPPVGWMRRPLGKVISLVVGILLVLVIGAFYARNWMKALPWNVENES